MHIFLISSPQKVKLKGEYTNAEANHAAASFRDGPHDGTRRLRRSSHSAIASSAARRRLHKVNRDMPILLAAASSVPSFICHSATACFSSNGSFDTASSVIEHSIASTGTHGLYPSLTQSSDARGLDPLPVAPVLSHTAQESSRSRISGIRAVVIVHPRIDLAPQSLAGCAHGTARKFRQVERGPRRLRGPFGPSQHETSTRLEPPRPLAEGAKSA